MQTIESGRRPQRAALVTGVLLAGLFTAAEAAELPTVRPADVGLSAERLARLDAAMQAEVDAGRKAGIVTLIARRGRDRAPQSVRHGGSRGEPADARR